MELWGWLVGYVALFALLHLLLYYMYVRRGDSDGAGSASFADPDRVSPPTSPGPDRYPAAVDDVDDSDDPEEDHELEFEGETIRCPHCGVRNEADQTFTYCWNCVSSLRQ
ncbi:DUF7577 domain-containing protein [Haloterrigena alkaliphila]|uniref:DUF7577 domain-containing protein n=1 Tax=Haloterrigena alkaliphila TaxID=2816475 RepID=A0A8A2VEW5_9EURY|nr:hypothetical protein [Haloterrigena alkaliphila]QSX00052.1 hypothetical protein J0X25_03540 [Haloterrigena alkaliphila]